MRFLRVPFLKAKIRLSRAAHWIILAMIRRTDNVEYSFKNEPATSLLKEKKWPISRASASGRKLFTEHILKKWIAAFKKKERIASLILSGTVKKRRGRFSRRSSQLFYFFLTTFLKAVDGMDSKWKIALTKKCFFCVLVSGEKE